jgi:hypothetical protein
LSPDAPEPDAVDSEGLDVVETLSDTVEVSHAISVGVLERGGVDLVDGGLANKSGST